MRKLNKEQQEIYNIIKSFDGFGLVISDEELLKEYIQKYY